MKINNTLKKLSAAVFFTFIIVLILHSCKKDNRGANTSTIGPPVISQAKAWYESTYPATLVAAANVKTRALNAASNGIFDYTQHIKPDWVRGASYTRYNTGVVELPIDPASQKISSDFKNMTNGNVLYNKKYSRSSFLLLYDGKGYQAYVMTIIADSAYVNNDMSKLALTTYKKRDPNFSGVVVYFTPTGKFISSYGYKNGTLLPPTPDASAANTTSVSHHTGGVATGRFHADEYAVNDCIDWYLDTYEDDVLISSEYLYTTCSPGTPTPGGGSPTSPTPCTTPTTTPPADAARFVPDVPIPTPTPGGDGDGGLPPPVPPAAPCPVTTTVADTTNNPCAQLAKLNAAIANAIIEQQNQALLIDLATSSLENGYDQNLKSWTSGTTGPYVPTPELTASSATPDQMNPPFNWDSTNGFTIGFSHDHPNGSGPSPADIFYMLLNSKNSKLTAAGQQAVNFYKTNASVTIVTSTNNYVVTINNWDAVQTIYNKYIANPAAFNANVVKTSQTSSYEAALLLAFNGAINLYTDGGLTNYYPLTINTTTNKVSEVQCPTM